MKWADFPDSKNSWEPSSILEDIDVREYIKASEDASCIPCPVQEALGCGFFYQTHKPGVLVDHLNRSHIHLLTHPVAINSVLEQVTALRHCHSCAVFYPSSSSAHNACRASVTEVADGNVSALPSGIRVTAVQGSVANGVVSFGNRSFKTRDCGSIVQVSVSMSHSNCCFYLAPPEHMKPPYRPLGCQMAAGFFFFSGRAPFGHGWDLALLASPDHRRVTRLWSDEARRAKSQPWPNAFVCFTLDSRVEVGVRS